MNVLLTSGTAEESKHTELQLYNAPRARILHREAFFLHHHKLTLWHDEGCARAGALVLAAAAPARPGLLGAGGSRPTSLTASLQRAAGAGVRRQRFPEEGPQHKTEEPIKYAFVYWHAQGHSSQLFLLEKTSAKCWPQAHVRGSIIHGPAYTPR